MLVWPAVMSAMPTLGHIADMTGSRVGKVCRRKRCSKCNITIVLDYWRMLASAGVVGI